MFIFISLRELHSVFRARIGNGLVQSRMCLCVGVSTRVCALAFCLPNLDCYFTRLAQQELVAGRICIYGR